MRSAIRHGAAIVAAGLVCAGALFAIGEARSLPLQQSQASGGGDLEVLQLRPNFFLIAGAGGHVAVQIGDDGVVVVDAGTAAAADAVAAAIRKLTPRLIRYVI